MYIAFSYYSLSSIDILFFASFSHFFYTIFLSLLFPFFAICCPISGSSLLHNYNWPSFWFLFFIESFSCYQLFFCPYVIIDPCLSFFPLKFLKVVFSHYDLFFLSTNSTWVPSSLFFALQLRLCYFIVPMIFFQPCFFHSFSICTIDHSSHAILFSYCSAMVSIIVRVCVFQSVFNNYTSFFSFPVPQKSALSLYLFFMWFFFSMSCPSLCFFFVISQYMNFHSLTLNLASGFPFSLSPYCFLLFLIMSQFFSNLKSWWCFFLKFHFFSLCSGYVAMACFFSGLTELIFVIFFP